MKLEPHNVASVQERVGGTIGGFLPYMFILFCFIGAMYPAIDLGAGEKERGTLETLLSSPAHRSEIVVGKLLTIMLFSIATAVLNLVSVGITGWVVLTRLSGF